ncbi:MAG TPA: M14 family zinc carboxypeptidase, partial [Bacteroidales bacterium]|nr:M14 family zinc carboxypeptidase [Bacteroidales bacterium]
MHALIKKTMPGAFILLLVLMQMLSQAQDVPKPAEFFGFVPGADRMLFNYDPLINYLKELENTSDRIKLEQIGNTPMGKPIYVAFISSPENITRLDELKNINKELAINTSLSDEEQKSFVEKGRVFFLATLSMHASEVGPSQSVPLIAYDLVTTSDPAKLAWMDKVVYMLTPSHNPDGMEMIVNNYNEYKDTKYEGSSLPGVYHKYVGHDNNRDFVALTQEDTKAISSIITEWYPQVTCEKHQMGSRGVRYFVPPPHDPIAENIDAGIWNWVGIFGSNMIKDMTKDSLAGVAQHYLFDEYWPGSTETCMWKNVIGFLTEAASVQTAKPIYIEPNELSVWGKGLSEYEKGINMPLPWEGGWWRLSDIVEYEIATTMSIIKTAATHDKDILKFRNDLARKEVQRGLSEAPYYYILPAEQHDMSELVNIVNLLMEHGIKVYKLREGFKAENILFEKGDIIIPMNQPFRPFIKEVMEHQEFPLRHYTPDGEIIRPYDITSWSLPLHNGLTSYEINTRPANRPDIEELTGTFSTKEALPDDYAFLVFPAGWNESYKAGFMMAAAGISIERTKNDIMIGDKKIAAGSFIVYPGKKQDALKKILAGLNISPWAFSENTEMDASKVEIPKIALVESFNHDMDAGWTRYLFDTYGIPFKVLKPADFESTDLSKQFDVIVFPSTSKSILMEGKYKSSTGDYYVSSYPPEVAKGMGKKGFEKLMLFSD